MYVCWYDQIIYISTFLAVRTCLKRVTTEELASLNEELQVKKVLLNHHSAH